MAFFDFFKSEPTPLVQKATEHMADMLHTAEDMFAAAAARLLDNEILDLDLHQKDQHINEREQWVRQLILEHLAVNPQSDMVFSLMLISIVQDAERIGDLTKSITKMADLAEGPRMGPYVEPLRPLRDRILANFDRVVKAFIEGDAEQARAVVEEADAIRLALNQHIDTLAHATDLSANMTLVLGLGTRMMNRISSHLSNIVSSVVQPFDKIRRSATWGDDE